MVYTTKVFCKILLLFANSTLDDKPNHSHLPYTNKNAAIFPKTVNNKVRKMRHCIYTHCIQNDNFSKTFNQKYIIQ